jgi:hypothetical protein
MSEVIKLHEPKFENSSWNFELDEVMPVTKGERNSLVTWVTGKQFK